MSATTEANKKPDCVWYFQEAAKGIFYLAVLQTSGKCYYTMPPLE